MPDSKRKQVLDAIVTALSASTGINKAGQNVESWWEWDITNFPGVTLIDYNTEIERIAYSSTDTDVDDMEARMEIVCRGFVHDMNNVLASKRTTLIKEIETVLVSSTGIAAKVKDVEILGIETDLGYIDNFSIFDSKFEVVYHFNHLQP